MKTDSEKASLMAWCILIIGSIAAGYYRSMDVIILTLITLYWWRISDFIEQTNKSIEEIKCLLKKGSN